MTIKRISDFHPNQYQTRRRKFRHYKLMAYFGIILVLTAGVGIDYQVKHPVIISPIPMVSADYATHTALDGTTPSPIPANPVEREANIDTIHKSWGTDWQTGVNIATCESGMRSAARNENTNGTEDQGVFQVNTIHGMPDMFNATANISYAYTLYLKQGLAPWESSKHCWENK